MDAFKFDPGLFLWTLLTFGLVLAVLARFAFRPLRDALQAREQAIRDSVSRAEASAAEAARLREQGQAQLQEAQAEARRLIDEGRRLALGIQEEARSGARQEAEAIVARAREEIDREVRKSMDDMRETVANISVGVARQIIRTEIDAKRHEEVVDYLIARLKEDHGKS